MKLKTAMLLIALSLPLAGCGNKGPLVLPQAPVPVDQAVPVAPEAEEGADTTPSPDAPPADAPVQEPATTDPVPPAEPVPAASAADVPPQDGDG